MWSKVEFMFLGGLSKNEMEGVSKWLFK